MDLLTRILRDTPFDFAEVFLRDGETAVWAPRLLAAASVSYDVTLVGVDEAPRRRGGSRPKLPPLLAGAQRRNACSQALTLRLERLYPGAGFTTVYPPEPDGPADYQVAPPPLRPADRLKILLLGFPAHDRDLSVVAQTVRRARKAGAPLQFFLLGERGAALDVEYQGDDMLVHLGAEADVSLNTLVCRLRPHLAWFPYDRPAYFDYRLSDAMLNGLPALASDLGSARERLAGRPYSWIMPANTTAEGWVETLSALQRTGLGPKTLKPSPAGPPKIADPYDPVTYQTRLMPAPRRPHR